MVKIKAIENRLVIPGLKERKREGSGYTTKGQHEESL